MVSPLANHVFTSFKHVCKVAEISWETCVMFDFVLMVFLDDVVVDLHNICCGCV